MTGGARQEAQPSERLRQAVAGPDLRALAARFAAHPFYRAGGADDLTLGPDVFRRPQRGEDIGQMDFNTVLGPGSFQSLRSLTFHRLLNAGRELRLRPPPDAGGPALADAAEMTRGLDRLCFHRFAAEDPPSPGMTWRTDALAAEMAGFWRRLLDHLRANDYLTRGVTFVVTQFLAILPAYHDIRDDLRADPPRPADRRRVTLLLRSLDRLFADLGDRARKFGLSPARHAHWQFYLAGGLAIANAMQRADGRENSAWRVGVLAHVELLLETFVRALNPAATADSAPGGSRLALIRGEASGRAARGFRLMDKLWRSTREDLATQLDWLARLDDFTTAAHRLSDRISREHPDIDRETFVEPREMVSTTHVHDDHRLVVVESGEMVFWGAAGMRRHLAPGDILYVPRGRLHGSAVTTRECVYHQPILPDDWVKAVAPRSLEAPAPATG